MVTTDPRRATPRFHGPPAEVAPDAWRRHLHKHPELYGTFDSPRVRVNGVSASLKSGR